MTANAIACGACFYPIPPEDWNREDGARCPNCHQRVRVLVFAAMNSNATGTLPAALQGEAEASCFYHPQNRAAQVCGECGRFLCNLCELDVDGRAVCPRCFEQAGPVVTHRTMHDTTALALSTFPVLFWPAAFVGAPWALFLVVRRWSTPLSIVPRTKIRFILAALFALSEISFAVFVVYMLTQVNLKAPSR
jgi:uncharacterized paraquat-inducible protein A